MKPVWVIYREIKTGEKFPKSRHKTKEAAINKCTELSLKNPKAKFVIEMEIK
jgi:hypothetical protein